MKKEKKKSNDNSTNNNESNHLDVSVSSCGPWYVFLFSHLVESGICTYI